MPRRARSERRNFESLFGATTAAPRAICASARYPSWTGKRTRGQYVGFLLPAFARAPRRARPARRRPRPPTPGADEERRRRAHAASAVARSWSAWISGSVRCCVHARAPRRPCSTPVAVRERVEERRRDRGASPSLVCVAKSASCIGQNLSCTDAHIAASAAGTAFWCMLSGMFRNASRTRPVFTYSCTMF